MSNGILPTTRPHDEPPSIDLPKPTTAPQLLWPSIEFGSGIRNKDRFSFPERSEIHHRRDRARRNDLILRLVAFEKAVKTALKHILVLDPHFDEIGANALCLGLIGSQAVDIRLLTRYEQGKERLRRELTDAINSNRDTGLQVEVQWEDTLDRRSFPFLHDRFAIVDGSLWHFGSTVGGGHPSLTAASGPWPASQTRSKEFFEECWRACHAR